MTFWFYQLSYALTLGSSLFLLPFSRKLRRGLQGRTGLIRRAHDFRTKQNADPIWFHVASSGELEQCIPVMDRLREIEPELPLALTYFSPSTERAIKAEVLRRGVSNRGLPWDYIDYSPLDLVPMTSGFVEALRPQVLVCVHREVWPGLIRECKKRKMRRLLIAAYFPPAFEKRLRWLFPWLKQFNFIGTTSELATQRLTPQIGSGVRIETWGDPRTERVIERRAMKKISPWRDFFTGPVFLAASIWSADWEAIAPGVESLIRANPDWRVILVPHEPHGKWVEVLRGWLKERSPGSLGVGHVGSKSPMGILI